MNALLRRLSRTGLRRGLHGEHWAWLVLAGAAYLLRRGLERPEASATVDLAPGERYLVRLVPPAKGRGRKGRVARELAELDLADLVGRRAHAGLGNGGNGGKGGSGAHGAHGADGNNHRNGGGNGVGGRTDGGPSTDAVA